jgi:restriction endonuclease Mrr
MGDTTIVDYEELFQKWASLVRGKVGGYSRAYLQGITKGTGRNLFLVDPRTDTLDYDNLRTRLETSIKISGGLYDEKTVRVMQSAISALESFHEYIKANGTDKLDEVVLLLSKRHADGYLSNDAPGELQKENIENVSSELLVRLQERDPFDFEQTCADLFIKMGYGDCKVTKKSNDGGIDGTIMRDALDLEPMAFQAKRYKATNKVGTSAINEFIGSIGGINVVRGIFITTSDYTADALARAEQEPRIKLINGEQFVDLLVRHEVGVKVRKVVKIYEIDGAYFGGEKSATEAG